eukprot:jgi/Bigna1/130222/aug1.10_g4930
MVRDPVGRQWQQVGLSDKKKMRRMGNIRKREVFWVLVRASAAVAAPAAGPSRRYDHSACFFSSLKYGKHIIVFGGCGERAMLKDVLDLDLASLSWRVLKNKGTCPRGRAGHTACEVYDKDNEPHLLVFGGKNLATYLNDSYLYSLPRNTWTRLRTMSYNGNEDHGHDSGADDSAVDTAASGDTPAPRAYHCAVTIAAAPDEKGTGGGASEGMLVYGGCSLDMGGGVEVFGDVYVLLCKTWEWRKIKISTAAHATGEEEEEEEGRGDEEEWEDSNPSPSPRYRHTMTPLQGSVSGSGRYLVMGGCGVDGEALNDAWILNDVGGVWYWTEVRPDPTMPPIAGHTAIIAKSGAGDCNHATSSRRRNSGAKSEGGGATTSTDKDRIFVTAVIIGGEMDGDEEDSDIDEDTPSHYPMNSLKTLEIKYVDK